MKLTRTWQAEGLATLETLFHNANGYLGVRNAPEEGRAPGSIRGAYINAFFEITDIAYGEKLYGFPESKQTLVNVQDAQTIRLWAGAEEYSMLAPETTERAQTLDTDAGVAVRSSRWHTQNGDLKVTVTRMASFARRNVFVMRYRVEALDYTGPITLTSALRGNVTNYAAADDPRVAAEALKCLETVSRGIEDGQAVWVSKTRRSDLAVCCRMAHKCPWPVKWEESEDEIAAVLAGELRPGEAVTLEKLVVYTDSVREKDCEAAGKAIMAETLAGGADALFESQRELLRDWYRDCCVKLDAPENLQNAMIFDQYALLESTGWDGFCNVAAKGLSGEGYEGHTFWDSEMYVFPYFLWTQPEKARGMLRYRCRQLEAARENARLLGIERGVLFPWRTISGTECSAYFPAGSAQYHINGDIAYAFLQYDEVTGDNGFMACCGAQVLVETARCWLSLGHMEGDSFRIDCVTGPDEYTCLVNNNFYTNAVARNNLLGAARVYRRLKALGLAESVEKATGVTEEEIAEMEKCGRAMYFPHDEKLGISAQDDSFLHKKKLDFRALPREQFPLLLHYHPLFLYRHQVCKQADTVLAHLLFPDIADRDTVERSYHYYQSVTTHDSSLSVCIFGALAARLGLMADAEKGFLSTAALDLEDTHGNTGDGLHTASLGGAFLAMLRGFAGVSVRDDRLTADPVLPSGWAGYEMPLKFRGRKYLLRVRSDAPYTLEEV